MDRFGTGLCGREDGLARYRYRTPAVTGRWRESREAAVRDAINAKQAHADASEAGGFRWVVPGTIEEEKKQGARPRLTFPGWASTAPEREA